MIFIGDVHGKTNELTHRLLGPEFYNKRAFQLGDMGIGFRGVKLREFPRKYFLWIRGNHDRPDWCREHPNYAGDFGYLEEEKLFFLGGAWSIDKEWRVPGESWWEDEELSYKELDEAYQLYVRVKPRIVATHEAPSKAAWSMLSVFGEFRKSEGGVYIPHAPCPTDQSVAVKGDEYEYYKAKLGCVNTRTSQALQRMFEEHQPEYWMYGHYHLTRTFKIGGTEFTCLNELDTKEILLADKEVTENKTDDSKMEV